MRWRACHLPIVLLFITSLALRGEEGQAGGKEATPGKEERGGKAGAGDKGKAPGKAEAGGKAASPAPAVPSKAKKPGPSPHLAIPAGLSEGARKSLEEAVAAYKEVEKAETGRDRLLGKAIEKLRSAAQKAFKSPLPLYYLGIAYQTKKNFPEARRVLEKALSLDPRFHEALTELADVHVWQKDLKGSLALYEKALEIEPSYRPAIENKALALIRLGQFKEAKPYLEEAQTLEPSDERKLLSVKLEVELKGPGWSKTYTTETENYQVLTSVSQELTDAVAKQAELIRRAYNKVFSDVEKPKRKFQIWVYDVRETESYHGGLTDRDCGCFAGTSAARDRCSTTGSLLLIELRSARRSVSGELPRRLPAGELARYPCPHVRPPSPSGARAGRIDRVPGIRERGTTERSPRRPAPRFDLASWRAARPSAGR